jgi:uncharacterized protein (TIGR00251 family)
MKVSVMVKPNSKVEEVVSSMDGLIVRVKEPPKEGKANRAVVTLLAGFYNVPRSSISIVSGQGARKKIIEIQGM